MQKKLIASNINDENNLIRLNKYLSDSGICSRREADRLIEAGRVKVNGSIPQIGLKISKNDTVLVDNKPVSFEEKLILLAVNKPEGIECTTDKSNPNNIIDFLSYPKKIFYIGRLDKDSHGLLLMTNDGDLANKIAKSVNHHEKEYIVKVNKKITPDFIKKMENGVEILDTVTRKCKVTKMDDNTFNIILTQGLNRQIRRMCEVLGYKVISLKRIRIMNIRLGSLAKGTYRNVTESEIKKLMESV